MVKLPGAESFGQRDIAGPQRQIVSVYRPGEAQRAAQEASMSAASSAQDIGRFANQQLDRMDKLDYATAQSRFLQEKAKADEEFSRDPDYATAKDRYTKRLADVRGAVSSEISNNQTRALFEQYTDADIAQGGARISGMAFDRERDAGRAHVNDLLEKNRETALMATNSATAQAVLSATRAAIDGAVAKGYLTEQEAQRQNRSFAESYAIGKIDLLTPAQQLETLRAGMKSEDGAVTFGQTNSFVDFIPSDKRMALIRSAENEVKRMGAMERAELSQISRDHFASVATTGQGVPGFMERARNALEPQQYAELVRQEEVSRETFNFTDSVKFATPSDIQDSLERLRPEPGSVGYADKLQAYQGAERMAEQIKKQRLDDPAGYAMKIPEISASWQAANSGEGGETLSNYSSKTLAAQEAMGIPEYDRRVLPVNVSKALVADLSAPDNAERAADQMMTLSQQYGPYWGSAYRDLVKDGLAPEMVVLGTLDTDADIVARNDLASALKTGQKSLSSLVPDADKKVISTGIDGALSAWSKAELGRGATDRNVQAVRSAAEVLALHYASRGQSPDQAATSAANALIGRYDILDTDQFNMYVPAGSADNIEMKGRRVLSKLAPEMLPDIGGQEFLTPQDRQAAYLESVRRGTWVLDNTGTNAIRLDEIGQPVLLDPSDPNSIIKFSIGDPAAMSEVERISQSISAEKQAKRGKTMRLEDWDKIDVSGMVEKGNINLFNRPMVRNEDGSISTVRSFSFNDGSNEILIPTVSDDGRIMSDDEAIQQYEATGRHLGKFKSARAADMYAKRLHDEQEKYYMNKRGAR